VAPNQPPAKPERLIQVADSRLNPGTRDFAVTIRFKTSRTFGNMIQKGQANTPGGYFKWQIPQGKLACLFRGRAPNGTVLSKSVNSGDILLNDDQWHTVRCERTVDRVTMTIDGVRTRKGIGPTGSISNTVPLTIAGKVNCDQATITCDYFVGEMDYIKIEIAPTGPPDVTPPTTPGQPVGVSNDYSSIDLSWPGSTDDVSSTVTYRIFRDGVWVATTTSSAPMVSYKDTGLVPDSMHVYGVVALDGAQNPSPMSDPSEPITVQPVPPVLIVDDFSGGLSSWTATRVTLDNADGSPSVPSARVQVSGESAFATRVLPVSLASACVSANVNETVFGGNMLLRLRTTSDGPISRVALDASAGLRFRSDVSGVQTDPLATLTAGWHSIEVCGTVGTSGLWDLYLDGVKILDSWVADTGTIPIGMVGLGDTTAKTWTANFDQVVVDLMPG
jgi:Laminin G domain